MDGIILINKPENYTSHDIVNIARKKLNMKKVGHTGTLDPKATGVLPILVGKATKISKYLIEHNKTYIATLKMGVKTTTADSEGEILETRKIEKEYNEEEITKTLNSFLGKQDQTPPIYSAIKINGKKAYEYARENKEIEIKKRQIEIYKINLISFNTSEITFEVECSKGTYIRTLCEDIANKLGTIGYMKALKRIKVDEFSIEDAIKLENISEKNIIKIEDVFIKKNKIDLNKIDLERFLNGVQIEIKLKDELYRIYNNNEFIGLGLIKNNILKRDVVII